MRNRHVHQRVPLAATATLTFNPGESIEPFLAMTADISLSGIGLYSGSPVRDDIEVTIDITFISAEGLLHTDSIKGSTVYVRTMENIYFIGIEFDEEINPLNHPLLHRHLQRILASDE